jgi:exopolyphosphatase / guanosine-5'-triphosphate,3'-diphosphate pyrophosphatase
MKETQLRVSAYALAREYCFEEDHCERVREMALTLFDSLRILHRLGTGEGALLEAAAILHDIGRYRGDKKHNCHSRDMILSSALDVSRREKQLIALIAGFHRGTVPEEREECLCGETITENDFYSVQACAALLRIADGLERSHSGSVKKIAVRHGWKNVHITVSASQAGELEKYAALKKADLFARLWHKSVTIDWQWQ